MGLHSRRLCTLFLAITSAALCQQGNVTGTVVDASGSSVAQAKVKLSLDLRAGTVQETQSSEGGEFTFSNVAPGPFHLTVNAKGFASKEITGELHAGETLNLPQTKLTVAILNTDVNVSENQSAIAQAQIKVEEQQRLVGVFPNFFTSYDPDAAPLNTKQKLELTYKTWLDPSAFVINGIIAGVWQARNTHKGFGQGGVGYAKRYGASFVDYGTSLAVEKLVMPAIFHQDPRYFYKGTGTTRSRILYAASRTMVCRGDTKKDQFCISTFIPRFGTGFLTNYFYPAADRDKTAVVLRGGLIGIGGNIAGNLFQEFLAKKITRKRP